MCALTATVAFCKSPWMCTWSMALRTSWKMDLNDINKSPACTPALSLNGKFKETRWQIDWLLFLLLLFAWTSIVRIGFGLSLNVNGLAITLCIRVNLRRNRPNTPAYMSPVDWTMCSTRTLGIRPIARIYSDKFRTPVSCQMTKSSD